MQWPQRWRAFKAPKFPVWRPDPMVNFPRHSSMIPRGSLLPFPYKKGQTGSRKIPLLFSCGPLGIFFLTERLSPPKTSLLANYTPECIHPIKISFCRWIAATRIFTGMSNFRDYARFQVHAHELPGRTRRYRTKSQYIVSKGNRRTAKPCPYLCPDFNSRKSRWLKRMVSL
jgi:hypothetical protein